MATEQPASSTNPLADPALHRAIEDFVRRRVPSADVKDIVQTVLCEALAAEGRPEDPTELKKWLLGIARHKVVDLHRRSAREAGGELPEIAAPPPPIEAREMARWAEQQVASTRDAKETLKWMAREGEGEKLESIAAEERVPAARVRQRVSRMRRWMKERWMAELAAVAALGLLAFLLIRLLRGPKQPEIVQPEPPQTTQPETPSPVERARELRAEAKKSCDELAWQQCLDQLDEAAKLDPAGDQEPVVKEMRQRATDALKEPPLPVVPQDLPKDSKEQTTPSDIKTAPVKTVTPVPVKPTAPPPPLKTNPKAKPTPKSKTTLEGSDFDFSKK